MKDGRDSRAVVVYSADQGTLVARFGRLNKLFLERVPGKWYSTLRAVDADTTTLKPRSTVLKALSQSCVETVS